MTELNIYQLQPIREMHLYDMLHLTLYFYDIL